MFFCRLNVMQAQQRPTKRTKRCNIVFHSDTFLNVFCPHLTLDYQDKNALKSTKRCKNLKKPNLTKTHLKVPITSYNKITDDIGQQVYFCTIFSISRALCVGYNPKEDHYSTKRGLFLPVLLLSSSINDAEAYYCVFSSSVDLIEIS